MLLAMIACSSLNAQNDRDKEFQIRGGFGFAVYGTATEIKYDLGGAEVSWKDTSGAVTRFIPLELRYEFHPRFNAGLDMKFGSYLYDPEEDNTGKSNRFATIGIALEANLVNKPNFRWYAGIGFNTTGLEISERRGTGSLSYTETSTWRGGGFKMNSGVLIFFGDSRFGLNTNLGYDGHNLKLQEIKRDDSNLNIDGLSGNLRLAGVDWSLGLVVRLY